MHRRRPTTRRIVISAVAVFIAGSACASGGPRRSTVEMDPMTFRVVDNDGKPSVEVMDPQTLFREGSRAFEDQAFDVAATKFGLIVDGFADSRYRAISAYNAGLSLLKLGRSQEALDRLGVALEATRGSKDAQDTLFQMALAYENLEDWDALHAIAQQVLEPHYRDIAIPERIQGLAQRGYARQKLGRLALAERDYKAALNLYRKHIANRLLDKNAAVALAQYQIGEIYRDLFASIRFKLPVERMERDLEDKSNFFLKAQSAYLRTLRLQQADYAVVAGFRLGALYEDFYDDMMAAEIPGELNREEIALYYEELRGKIRPLLVRAIDIYERNLRMGQRFGKTDDWIRRTEASLARLKEVLRQESTRDAEAQIGR